nr:amidohydrolase family protein [Sphingomonas sp. CDS-1]
MKQLLVRNAVVDGRLTDIALRDGRIVAIATNLRGEELFDARGGRVIPGLHDHHVHLMATAAMQDSVALDGCLDLASLTDALRQASARLPQGAWLRASGLSHAIGAMLDRRRLDSILSDRPLRVQHQTGSLWVLNGAAIDRIGGDGWPEGAERDAAGLLTGRLFRCDRWLGERIGRSLPDLARLGHVLASYGITGATDASVTTDPQSATALADAVRSRHLALRLTLMSGEALPMPEDGAYALGPVKILLDDDKLPSVDALSATIRRARDWGRSVAAHCVTAGELAVMLAALGEAGARAGDRIEHGSVIPREAIPVLKALRLTVVTQPAFIDSRGDRYLRTVDPEDQPDLYRCASLMAAGVPVAGSSDGPYGDLDPWLAMRTAMSRRTQSGAALLKQERISAASALNLYLAPPQAAGGAPRRLTLGQPGDLCVLVPDGEGDLARPDRRNVAATIMDGWITYDARVGVPGA